MYKALDRSLSTFLEPLLLLLSLLSSLVSLHKFLFPSLSLHWQSHPRSVQYQILGNKVTAMLAYTETKNSLRNFINIIQIYVELFQPVKEGGNLGEKINSILFRSRTRRSRTQHEIEFHFAIHITEPNKLPHMTQQQSTELLQGAILLLLPAHLGWMRDILAHVDQVWNSLRY